MAYNIGVVYRFLSLGLCAGSVHECQKAGVVLGVVETLCVLFDCNCWWDSMTSKIPGILARATQLGP